jgi:hypothetical protein
MSHIEDLWYYATAKGLEQAKDQELWWEKESRITVTAELVGWQEIRSLGGDVLFQLQSRRGIPALKNLILAKLICGAST